MDQGVIAVGITLAEMLLCALLGIVLLTSSIPKLRHPKGFVVSVLLYRILPPKLGHIFAWAVPATELLCALLLLSGTAVRLAAALTALLLVSFIIAIAINVLRGRDLDCHCFGARAQRHIGWRIVGEDIALLCGSLALISLVQPWLALTTWSVFQLATRPLALALPRQVSTADFTSFIALGLCVTIAIGSACLLPTIDKRRHAHRRGRSVVERQERQAAFIERKG